MGLFHRKYVGAISINLETMSKTLTPQERDALLIEKSKKKKVKARRYPTVNRNLVLRTKKV